MTTVQEVFDAAIHLMDEQNESSGATETQDTTPYKVRTINILNVIIPSLYPYSDTYEAESVGPGKRPIPPKLQVANYREPDFAQAVPLDDGLAMGVLPYGLASHLLAGENEELAAFFSQRFEMALSEFREKIPASFEPIGLPYGLF